ncbi:NADP-dependent oxidoreductase [Corallococcus macrosporus]|uniref:NADP-dependent oxidoreductase n=1 Tax=Corallococcus macrosporus TaxID=35 RepID=A0ABS3D6L0_9BACT|nr:NADP-dependent oxidoreductase [Corallococcus macrosporus]MBN8227299.1 NADP-dependent oxidoreductase [Corallococcus macrosporus]
MPATIPDKMKAAALDRFGGPEVLGIKTVSVPTCGDDEVLVRVAVAGIGAWDWLEREGKLAELLPAAPRFPYVPGADGAGEIVAVGKNVKDLKVGDQVYGSAFMSAKGGFYAEYVAVKKDQASRIPKGLKVEQAAVLAADGITALEGLEDHLQLKAGQRLIIFGANGGIGHMAVQFAKRMGANVLAVASGEDGVELARRVGADAVVDGRKGDFDKVCREFAPDGFDAALVLASGDAAEKVLQHVKKEGRIAWPHGVEPAPKVPEGIQAKAYDGIPGADVMKRMNALIEAGPFHLEIGRIYALEEAAKAQQEVLKHHLGKYTIRIH